VTGVGPLGGAGRDGVGDGHYSSRSSQSPATAVGQAAPATAATATSSSADAALVLLVAAPVQRPEGLLLRVEVVPLGEGGPPLVRVVAGR